MAGSTSQNKKNSPKARKVTSHDQIGRGSAKAATRTVEKQKKRNRSALEMARGSLGIKK